MKKIFLSSFVIVLFIAYVLHQRIQRLDETNVVVPQNVEPSKGSYPSPYVTASNSSGGYGDGEYTGDVADAYYGNVQVKAVIQNGKITDIQFLDYPHDRQTSERINSQAIPILRQEVIQAQNAEVDGVSGATQTSKAFVESLRSALTKARK